MLLSWRKGGGVGGGCRAEQPRAKPDKPVRLTFVASAVIYGFLQTLNINFSDLQVRGFLFPLKVVECTEQHKHTSARAGVMNTKL